MTENQLWRGIRAYYELPEFDCLSRNHWQQISCYEYLTEEFMDKYVDKLDWRLLINNQILSGEFIERHLDKMGHDVIWGALARNQALTEEFIDKHLGKFSWNYLCKYQKISKEFIIRYLDYIDVDWLMQNKHDIVDEELMVFFKLRGLL